MNPETRRYIQVGCGLPVEVCKKHSLERGCFSIEAGAVERFIKVVATMKHSLSTGLGGKRSQGKIKCLIELDTVHRALIAQRRGEYDCLQRFIVLDKICVYKIIFTEGGFVCAEPQEGVAKNLVGDKPLMLNG